MFWIVPAAAPTDGPGLGLGGVFFMMVVTGLAGLVGLGAGTAIGLTVRGHPYAISTAAIAVGLAAALLLLPVVGVAGWMAAPALARLIRTRAGTRQGGSDTPGAATPGPRGAATEDGT